MFKLRKPTLATGSVKSLDIAANYCLFIFYLYLWFYKRIHSFLKIFNSNRQYNAMS